MGIKSSASSGITIRPVSFEGFPCALEAWKCHFRDDYLPRANIETLDIRYVIEGKSLLGQVFTEIIGAEIVNLDDGKRISRRLSFCARTLA